MKTKNFARCMFALIGLLLMTLSPMITTPAFAASACITSRISASTDDATQGSSSNTMYLTDTTLNTQGGSAQRWWGLRFQNVTVPQGATITSASVTFRAPSATSATPVMDIYGEALDNAPTFTTTSSNISNRSRTAAVVWNMTAWTAGSDYTTPDLTTPVQAIVNRAGWNSGNAIAILGLVRTSVSKVAVAWDDTTQENQAALTICYSSTTPTITTSGTLTAFKTQPGVASTPPQTYTVSGSNLSEDILITAPTGFQLSTDGTNYYSSLTLPQTGGSVSSTTIRVRLYSATEGTFTGNIVHTSTGATEVDIAVSGTVSNCLDVSLEAVDDGYLSGANTTNNYGTSTTLKVSTNTTKRGSLFKWDVGTIPTNATVTNASLTLYVSTAGTQPYYLYNMRRAWVEGTGAGSVTGDGATWQTYDGTNAWGADGAADTTSDRYDTNLWGADTSSFGSTGSKTVSLNPDGIAVIQGWIAGTTNNYGVTMQNYSSTTTSDLQFASAENTSNAGATLNVTYCVSTGPTITTSGTLTAFSTQPGVASTPPQTYTVAGSSLSEDILITAPTGFQLSTDGTNYYSSLTLPQTGGSVSSTTIRVRLYSATEGTFTGNIAHSSNGATTKNVAVNGMVSNCTTVSVVATEDTYLSANDVTYNNGGNTELHVNATTGTDRRTTLLKWDLSSIPSNATVSSASLSLNVTDASSLAFNLYNMRRTWVEGTGNRTASDTSANWNTYDGATSWGTVGAANTSSDRYDTNLWSASTSSFSSTGSKTEALNADGVAVVQGWVSGSLGNYGLIIQNYSGSTNDAVYFSSSETTTEANRPKLSVTYCLAGATTYTLSVGNDGNGTVNPSSGTYPAGTVVTLTPVPTNSSYQFATWTGTNAADPKDNGDGTWSLTMNGDKYLSANFTLLTSNVAPNQPVLVQPTDDATGVSTSPTLQVTASDPNASDTLSVSFYGRAKGTTAGPDFTLVVIPDAQNYATGCSSVYTNHLQWIADNKTYSNIVFATAVGDLVNTSSSASEYSCADAAFDTLDAGNVSYSVGPGNHDMAMGSTLWPTYFGTSRFSGKSYYGGSYDNYNNYYLFSASGNDFILINLQYGLTSGSAQLNWADSLLKANPSRRAIVEEHDILNTNTPGSIRPPTRT
jgi:hypothetical protein